MEQETRWIEQAQAGDKNAFRKLVELYQRRIFAFCYDLTGSAQDAEDLSQEVFVKMWKNLDSFRSEAKLGSWLYRIAVNAWIDTGRKKNVKVHRAMQELEDETMPFATAHPNAGENPLQAVESNLVQQEILHALDALTAKERAVFTLRHYDDLKLDVIGDRLGVTTGTVKSLLFRAVQKLQKELTPLAKEMS
jgi:RNA polymerase sigma-70 factor (ECF subfamily)